MIPGLRELEKIIEIKNKALGGSEKKRSGD
jgi:hypothetical protein